MASRSRTPRDPQDELMLLDHDAAEREAEREVEGAPAPDPRARRKPLALLILETMRPKQWIKNSFVFAGLLFAGKSLHLGAVGAALAVFVAFCLASGATYLLNDANDAEADKHNPRTASRPIARGDLSPGVALLAAS